MPGQLAKRHGVGMCCSVGLPCIYFPAMIIFRLALPLKLLLCTLTNHLSYSQSHLVEAFRRNETALLSQMKSDGQVAKNPMKCRNLFHQIRNQDKSKGKTGASLGICDCIFCVLRYGYFSQPRWTVVFLDAI